MIYVMFNIVIYVMELVIYATHVLVIENLQPIAFVLMGLLIQIKIYVQVIYNYICIN